jgi:S-adenosyl-L-methionine hydrolase (adenosine-forming)
MVDLVGTLFQSYVFCIGFKMSIITLMTDFGLKDGNVGVMKGVFLSIAPHAQIIDLSHLISPQNVREAALILARSAPYFPNNTIHVVVVDPGVGTSRRPLAAQIGSQRYVLPDNGLLTIILQRAEQNGQQIELVHLDKPTYWLQDVSHVFHGRDIFAPVAGHLAMGVPLTKLGTIVSDPVRLVLPPPQPTTTGLLGEIIHVDHFGNLATNIRREHLKGATKLIVLIGKHQVNGLVKTFGERSAGEAVALYGSSGDLIVSIVNGNAAQSLGVQVGDPVEVIVEGSHHL